MARFILDKSKAIEQYSSLKHLGEVMYNLKTNPAVGKVLQKGTDARFVVSSAGGLKHVKPARVCYLIQGEPMMELKNMVESGISSFIVDNENDLAKLTTITDDIELFLRVRVKEHTVYTGKYFVYGIDWRRAREIIPDIKVRSLGVHFHRKTQNIGEWDLLRDLQPLLSSVLSKIDKLNIGGGLPWTYVNSKPDLQAILAKLETVAHELDQTGIKMVLEPGRYIAAPAVQLETNILNSYDNSLIIDASIYNAAMDTYLFNIRLPVQGETEQGHKYLIKGCSPDSLDIFRYKVFFPEQKNPGDTLTFLSAGAYNFHTNFADLPKIKTELV
ncbi:MAG: decarboxylase [Candidatus Altiarchaeota archaeon]|nr:decarboxylase [Candidatus Altiarchaeota archaeon]